MEFDIILHENETVIVNRELFTQLLADSLELDSMRASELTQSSYYEKAIKDYLSSADMKDFEEYAEHIIHVNIEETLLKQQENSYSSRVIKT